MNPTQTSVAEIADAFLSDVGTSTNGSEPGPGSAQWSTQAAAKLDEYRFSEHLGELVGQGIDNHPITDVGLGTLGATPVHRVTFIAPVTSPPPS